MEDLDARFMKEAIRQARKGLGRTSPNPAVGAVVVKEGRILASGYHKKAGAAHAEVDALNKLGKEAVGAVLYVTLEPCNHYGRTPPCTEAILRSGVRRVVAGMRDPNARVKGGGCEVLARKGLEVKVGVLEEACRRLNEAFIKHAATGRPFVTVKSALTLDGWTAASTGHSRWVTNERSRAFVHRLRDRTDAVMVGVGTVLADDPSLTTRFKRGRGKSPLRIIVDSRLRTPLDAKCLDPELPAETLIAVGENAPQEKVKAAEEKGARVVVSPASDGKVDLTALMDILGGMSITSLLVEGGAAVIGSLIRQALVDKFYIFKAPKILGGDDGVPMASGPGPKRMDDCLALGIRQVRRFGDDILIEGYPKGS